MTRIRKLRRESLGFAIGSLCFAVGALPGYLGLVGQQADNITYAIGSACFLIASALAILATTHREGLWDPEARNWWSSWLNMAGSVAFAASAIASYLVPETGEALDTELVNSGTFVGAICFLVAALLVRPARGDTRS